MKHIEDLIDSVVGLPKVTPQDLNPITGCDISLKETRGNWEFYKGTGKGFIVAADLRLSVPRGRWLLSLAVNPPRAPAEKDVDMKRYGARVSMDVNPDVFPEGIHSYRYTHRELFIAFRFTHKTCRLVDVVIRKD